MASAEGMRQRRRLHTAPAHSTSELRGDDDEMIDYENTSNMRRTASVSNVAGSDVSTLYRFVNHYVVRYCVRIRDALRSMLRGSSSSSSAAAAAPAAPPSSQTRAALEILDTIQKTAFSYDVPDHEQALRELWGLLGQGDFARTGPQWSAIGFQGKDPSTDFRGQGALGLRNMVFFARSHPDFARQMVSAHDSTLPFAIAVINISAHLLILLNANAGRLGNALFEFVQSSSEALALFDKLFCLVFVEFVTFHRQAIAAFVAAGGNPALAVMQFNPIRARFFETLTAQIFDGSFMTNYVERCGSAGAEPEVDAALPSYPPAGDGRAGGGATAASARAVGPHGGGSGDAAGKRAEPAVGVLVDLS